MKRIGIDFGTSTTFVAYRLTDSSLPEILPIGTNFPWMPSVVSESPPYLVGEIAEKSDNRKLSVKSELTSGEESGSPVLENTRDQVKSIFREVIDRAKDKNKDLFKDAKVFLGCPALWTSVNRKIISDIASELGLNIDVTTVIDEPVAAGVQWAQSQWSQSKKSYPEGKTLIFDAGGGTLDIAYLDLRKSIGDDQLALRPTVTVLSAGSIQRAGDDVDDAICRYLLDRDPELQSYSDPGRELLKVARSLKEALSTSTEESVNAGKPFSRSIKLSRIELEDLVKNQVHESMQLVKKVIKESILRTNASISGTDVRQRNYESICREVKNVVLVGGFSKMPIFEAEVQKTFSSATIFRPESPQQAVAEGLTYGDGFLRLNMPRPPLSFFVSSKNFGKHEVCAYEAYSPVYDELDLLRGNAYLATRIDFGQYGDGEYSFHCELPDRKRTVVPFAIKNDDSEDTFESLTVVQDTRSMNGHVIFVLYTTGEICIRGLNKEYLLRVKLWPSLSEGVDITEMRLEAERVRREDFGNFDLEAWRIPTG
jgi:hypothetical protein